MTKTRRGRLDGEKGGKEKPGRVKVAERRMNLPAVRRARRSLPQRRKGRKCRVRKTPRLKRNLWPRKRNKWSERQRQPVGSGWVLVTRRNLDLASHRCHQCGFFVWGDFG
eukprot:Protomagalhaensia_sp_Gyna_25__1556@NODE_17_length_8134_cov_42_750093_g11_i0_p8_GENE_NODE_17_length_8134_cov_42_750093_g11_i0NODE_17_length_8134_cov_42_750093_g11_i0_p8_ORF_typecomplete_len110_score4_12TRAUB/PF08164_12/0_13_NODE_17_length_8134_cov_42_750093_g11_i0652981